MKTKVFQRSFSKKEVVLIIILAVILLGLLYYRFVDQGIRSDLDAAKNAIEVNQSELDISTAQLLRMNSMDQELNKYEAGGASRMPSYNSVKKELALLDEILANTDDYTISLQDPVLSGDLVRRNVEVRFTASNFRRALSVVKAFSESELRNVIRDISYSSSTGRDGSGTVSVNMNVTFYETMSGGKPDAGLIMPEPETPAAEETVE